MKHWILLLYLGFSVMLRAQNTASVQEAMANYDYKTVIRLIDEESASPQSADSFRHPVAVESCRQ